MVQKNKYFVDFPDIPGMYDCIAIYATNNKTAKEEALRVWTDFTGKQCHKLPTFTKIRSNDPYAGMRARQSKDTEFGVWD